MDANHYFNKIKQRHSIESDYKLAKLLGESTQRISTVRTRNIGFGDDLAIKVAKLLDMEPAAVIADMHEQRATKEEVKAIWREIAQRMAGSVDLVFIAVLGLTSSAALLYFDSIIERLVSVLYILCKKDSLRRKPRKLILLSGWNKKPLIHAAFTH